MQFTVLINFSAQFKILPSVLARAPLKYKAALMDDGPLEKSCQVILQGLLEETFFDNEHKQDLTRQDIIKLGELIAKMLRLEPPIRASATEIQFLVERIKIPIYVQGFHSGLQHWLENN